MKQILKITAITSAIVSLLSFLTLIGIYLWKAYSLYRKFKKGFFTFIPSFLIKRYKKRKRAKAKKK